MTTTKQIVPKTLPEHFLFVDRNGLPANPRGSLVQVWNHEGDRVDVAEVDTYNAEGWPMFELTIREDRARGIEGRSIRMNEGGFTDSGSFRIVGIIDSTRPDLAVPVCDEGLPLAPMPPALAYQRGMALDLRAILTHTGEPATFTGTDVLEALGGFSVVASAEQNGSSVTVDGEHNVAKLVRVLRFARKAALKAAVEGAL